MDIIVLRHDATDEDIRHIIRKLENRGLQANLSKGTEITIIGVIGDTSKVTEDEEAAILAAPGVENVVRGLEAGADDFLTKPFQPEVVRATVHRACERTRLLRENVLLTTNHKLAREISACTIQMSRVRVASK